MTACKKEKTEISAELNTAEKSSKDTIDGTTISTPNNLTKETNIVIGTDVKAAPGKVIFVQNSNTMFYFDNNSNEGSIKINDKIYTLNSMLFQENNYEISGKGIKITAENGDFKEMKTSCLFGNFPEVIINFGTETVKLTNVNVQDCPNY